MQFAVNAFLKRLPHILNHNRVPDLRKYALAKLRQPLEVVGWIA